MIAEKTDDLVERIDLLAKISVPSTIKTVSPDCYFVTLIYKLSIVYIKHTCVDEFIV